MKTQKGKKISLKKFTIAKIPLDDMNTIKGGTSNPTGDSYSIDTNIPSNVYLSSSYPTVIRYKNTVIA